MYGPPGADIAPETLHGSVTGSTARDA